jgi:hypothetical protein
MLYVIGVIPYEKDWMVFTINQTFTDQVRGFGSSVRRSSVATSWPPNSGSSSRRRAAGWLLA